MQRAGRNTLCTVPIDTRTHWWGGDHLLAPYIPPAGTPSRLIDLIAYISAHMPSRLRRLRKEFFFEVLGDHWLDEIVCPACDGGRQAITLWDWDGYCPLCLGGYDVPARVATWYERQVAAQLNYLKESPAETAVSTQQQTA